MMEVGLVAEMQDYTPDKIDGYLRRWLELTSQAESPSAPRLLASGAQPAKGQRSDHLRSVVIVADLEKATVTALIMWSMEWQAVTWRMQGKSFGQIAMALNQPKTTVYEAYQRAIKRMALYLGWEETDPNETC